MENLKLVEGDAKVTPNCLMPKFKQPKVTAIRSFPESLMQFDKSSLQKTQGHIDELEIERIKTDVAVGEKLVDGENNGISGVDRAMKVEAVVAFERKDGEQIARIETIDELGNTEHIDMMNVVDTLKRSIQVDNGACLDLAYELKMRERDIRKTKRRKVSSLRDFPKDLKSYEVEVGDIDKSKEDCVKGTNDETGELLKVDFMSREDLVDPVVAALSRGDEFEKQEPVGTVNLETVLQSDVELELHGEALKDQETISKFECGEHDNENVSHVETASEDAENVQLLNELCTSVVYPCRFPKTRKVSAVRDFPDALKILNAHNEASEKNRNHREADKLAGKNETTCDSHESSAPTEKSLSRNSRTLITPPKEDTVNFDEQELANCQANSTALSTESTSEVANSNKRIGGKEEREKCINKTIVKDSIATPRCTNMPSQCYRSDTKTNQDKGKGKGKDEGLKRKQNEDSAPITVVLALMAPTAKARAK